MAIACAPRSAAAAPAPRYERFSRSQLWARQRAYFRDTGIDAWRRGEVPHYITSTAGTAHVYADAVVAYWQAALAAGDVDATQPLYVLELGAGCGRFTHLLSQALRARQDEIPGLSWCLLASDIVPANLEFIAGHPCLRDEVAAGRLDTVLWDAERGGPLRLRAQARRVAAAANPLVIVANYVFDGLRQDLFGFAHGGLLEGRVAAQDEEAIYRWEAIAQADWLPEPWQRLLQRYAERLAGSSLLLPSGALRCLEHLERLAPAGSLLLSADKGAFVEHQLRGGDRADFAFHGSFSLPVNYHAITALQEERGARCWNGRQRDDGLVYHLELRARQPQRYAAGLGAIVRRLQELNPDDHFTLKKSLEHVADQLAPEQLLALLRMARHDTRVLGLMIPALLRVAPAILGESRALWHEALRRCWANYYPLGEEGRFQSGFAVLAAQLGHWGLAREALQLDLACHADDVLPLRQLAQCEAATGRIEEARLLAGRAAQAGDRGGEAMLERLQRRQPAVARDGELALEPIAIEHAAGLLEQYRDPQIGILTRLPELDTLEEAVAWIVEQQHEAGRMTYAVMHRCWGFVGVVSLRRRGSTGFFWFWTGTDHQGRGLGRAASALLLRHAAQVGVREVYTCVYQDNARSLAALAALGFAPLDVRAEAPDQDLGFFRWPAPGAAEPPDVHAALAHLLARMDSPIRLQAAGVPE